MSWSPDEPDDFPNETGTIREIIDRGPTNHIHLFEQMPSDERELAKEATGITNKRGGVILIGVDIDGMITGLVNPEETYYQSIETLEEYIEPELSYSLRLIDIDDEQIIVIKIDRYTKTQYKTIHAMEKRFYMRGFHSSNPLRPTEVASIIKNIE